MAQYEEQRKEIQQKISEYLDTEEGKKNKGRKINQKVLGEWTGYDQSAISRYLKGYHIDWKTGEIEKEEEPKELLLMLKKSYIKKISVFFLFVPKANLKTLSESLLKYFPSTDTRLGIIKIEKSTTPRGLVIFSDDNNLEYYLSDESYITATINEIDNH